MTTYAAAHIVTSEAVAMGDPEVVVMTRADEPHIIPEEIARYDLPEGTAPEELLNEHDWQVTGDRTDVEVGYYIVDVESKRG